LQNVEQLRVVPLTTPPILVWTKRVAPPPRRGRIPFLIPQHAVSLHPRAPTGPARSAIARIISSLLPRYRESPTCLPRSQGWRVDVT
jgi:hypothetical protein